MSTEVTENGAVLDSIAKEVGPVEKKAGPKKEETFSMKTDGFSLWIGTAAWLKKDGSGEYHSSKKVITIGNPSSKRYIDIYPDEKVLAAFEEKMLPKLRAFCAGEVGGLISFSGGE
jgi:hypothetical protein